MIKKTEKPAEAPRPAATKEAWNEHWSIQRRLLEARLKLRGTKLSQQFETERSFEAFSIHTMARGIEEVMLSCGILASFQITKWSKSGNVTVVEGLAQFTSVDDGEIWEVATFGEGVDDSDKGAGKALSYARKNGFIQALNLSVGTDNEETNERAQPQAPAGPTMGGSPQQTMKQAAPAANGHAPAGKMYTLQQQGVKARAMLSSGVLSNCWAVVQNSNTVTSLDDWEALNLEMLTELSKDNPALGAQVHKLVVARRETLTAKGAL